MQKEIDDKETDHQESVKTLKEKHSAEVKTLKTAVATLETSNNEAQEEVHVACVYVMYYLLALAANGLISFHSTIGM